VTGTVLQVNLSRGGLPKRPVAEAFLTPLGFEGDSVAHPSIHGGLRKAVLLIASEAVDELVERGFPLFYGALGENLTTRGLDRRALRPGMRLRVGEAVLEITKLRTPCRTLDAYGPAIQEAIREDSTLGGFYASVTQPGWVRANDIITVVDVAV
jgi:MOSC domain-containing protein YiiM